jgi:plastocyanin
MRSRLVIVLATAASTLALSGVASAGLTPVIEVIDNGGADDRFDPEERTILVGAGGIAGTWDELNANDHNVVQDRKMFNSGPPEATRDPFELDPSAGTFPYYCALHGGTGGRGMSGVLKVSPTEIDLKRARGDEIVFGFLWAEGSSGTGDQFDVQYKAGNGDWKSWKKNTSKRTDIFGQNGDPVTVRNGKAYKLRVRSEKSSNPKKKHSGWSPALAFGTSA